MRNFYIDCPSCNGENKDCYKCEGEGVLTVDVFSLPAYTSNHPHGREIDLLAKDAARCNDQFVELCRRKPEMVERYRQQLEETIAKLNKDAQALWEQA